MVAQSVSESRVGKSAICWMNVGLVPAVKLKNSIIVVVNAVALTCFVPFTKTSALVPFHLMTILVVSVVV